MGAVENELARKNNTLQKWVQARYVPIQRVVYKSKGPESRDTMPALDPTGKLDLSFLSTGSGGGLDADTLDGQHGAYYLPAATYTASDALTKIKTVDGTGSGLDADLLDGNEAAALAKLSGAAFSGAITAPSFSRTSFGASGTSATPVWDKILFQGDNAHQTAISMGNSFTDTHGTWLKLTVNSRATASTPIDALTIDEYGIVSFVNQPTAPTFMAAAGGWGTGYQFSSGAASFFGNSSYVGINGANSGTIFISRTDANPSFLSIGNGNANSQNVALNMMSNGAAATTATLILERLAGANGNGELRHYGTGSFTVNAVNAAILYLATSNAVRMTVSAAGLVGIGVAPATQKLKVLGSVAVGGDEGGTAAYTTFTNATAAVSTGTVTVKSRTASNVNTTGFLKVFVGTAAKYVPYVD